MTLVFMLSTGRRSRGQHVACSPSLSSVHVVTRSPRSPWTKTISALTGPSPSKRTSCADLWSAIRYRDTGERLLTGPLFPMSLRSLSTIRKIVAKRECSKPQIQLWVNSILRKAFLRTGKRMVHSLVDYQGSGLLADQWTASFDVRAQHRFATSSDQLNILIGILTSLGFQAPISKLLLCSLAFGHLDYSRTLGVQPGTC